VRWMVAGLVATVALLVVLTGAVAGIGGFADANGLRWSPPPQGPARIPPTFLVLYGEAAARFGIPAPLLAAVGKVESDHGRDPDCLVPNVAGAVGPMQFLPDTFAAYAWASGSPVPSMLDPRDAVFAAAAKLAADDVNEDPAAALFAYNHSQTYVAQVLTWAVAYGWVPNGPGWFLS
jgi:membrane-bound lytic murein transglycosylase B